MIKATRENIIEQLIDNTLDTIEQGMQYYDSSYIYSILNDGFKGFENFTNQELEEEYKEIFEEEIKIE